MHNVNRCKARAGISLVGIKLQDKIWLVVEDFVVEEYIVANFYLEHVRMLWKALISNLYIL